MIFLLARSRISNGNEEEEEEENPALLPLSFAFLAVI
jgi:hypothetical protein